METKVKIIQRVERGEKMVGVARSYKYYKPITVQYYIANCVSWVPRLTVLSL